MPYTDTQKIDTTPYFPDNHFYTYIRPNSPNFNDSLIFRENKNHRPEENLRIDFPLSEKLGLSQDDIRRIELLTCNISNPYFLSYQEHPKTAFFTRYSDGRLVLNRKGGPAVIYNNGDSQYWIRGRRISDRLIRKIFEENISGYDILLIPNIEDRRDVIECLGSDEFAKRISPFLKIVSTKVLNDQLYTLYKVGHDDVDTGVKSKWIIYSLPTMYFLKVIDSSTDREYYLQVPPSVDAIESLAWTFGMTKREYLPMLET